MRLYRLIMVLLVISLTACTGGSGKIIQFDIPELGSEDYGDAAFNEGWRSLKNGKANEAIELFRQSSVSDEKLYLAFGYAYLTKSKFEIASRNFQKVLELNPQNVKAEIGLAMIFEAGNDREKSFYHYSNLIKKYPENFWLKGKYQQIRSDAYRFYLEKARNHLAEQEEDDYIAAMEKADIYSLDRNKITLELTDYFINGKQPQKALNYLEKFLQNNTATEEILYKMAGIYHEMKKVEMEILMYKKLQDLKPNDIEISNKINELKLTFYDTELPPKFKNIYFKPEITREELAAVIAHYFEKYLEKKETSLIIPDIADSFARESIVLLCSLKIMVTKPDFRFDLYTKINRSDFSVIIRALVKYLEDKGHELDFDVVETEIEPADLSTLHKNYQLIKFLLNLKILKLDETNNFNPTGLVKPEDVIDVMKRLLRMIEIVG